MFHAALPAPAMADPTPPMVLMKALPKGLLFLTHVHITARNMCVHQPQAVPSHLVEVNSESEKSEAGEPGPAEVPAAAKAEGGACPVCVAHA